MRSPQIRRLTAGLASLAALSALDAAIADDDAWAFSTADDSFLRDAALDVGALLNEKIAGETGFVRLSADGMSFLRGDGEPIRFWAVVSDGFRLKPDEMERHAAWLAKRGVNLVRVHANLSVNTAGAKVTDVDRAELDGILRWVAVCKRHGIYVVLSPFWAHAHAPASWGVDGYADDEPWGVLFFNPEMQRGYRAWVTALYRTPNPYAGGVPLADEPAVAVAQVQNEDSLLFWTFDAIKPAQKRVLGARFGEWVRQRYGSIEQAQAAWKQGTVEGDDPTAGVLGFCRMWELTSEAPRHAPGLEQRLADQLEFLASLQRDFYAKMETFYRQDLGLHSLTNACNWRSADQVTLDDAERYTYTPMSVAAVNYYTGGAHLGANNGYRIDPGHTFTNGSVLLGTAPLPCNLKQTQGHPMMITETAWVHPNLYQSEGPFLMTAYESLTGVDATFWFAYGDPPEWERDPRALFWPVGSSYAAHKWYGNHPMQAGQFPAFAIAFRRGYIRAATQPAVYEERALADLWTRRIPMISESGRFDPNRDAGSFAPQSPVHQEIDRAAFFVGPVVVRYGGEAQRSQTADLARHLDARTGDVRSLTGELMINQRRHVATIDAPRIQGVCGFLDAAGEDFRLGATTWRSRNAYAAMVAVSLDGQDLVQSGRILVQVGTTARLRGFATRPARIEAEGKVLDGEEIVSNGEPPWMVAATRATLTLANRAITRGIALDSNLYRKADVAVKRDGGNAVIELPPDAMYVVLERGE